jgi:hypothetical protein
MERSEKVRRGLIYRVCQDDRIAIAFFGDFRPMWRGCLFPVQFFTDL